MRLPVGTAQQVLTWVADDPARAAALEGEQTGVQRSALMSELEAIASRPEEGTAVSKSSKKDDVNENVEIPEPPVLVELTPDDEDVTVGVVHRRDADVEVGTDLALDGAVISAEQVEYFQVAGSPNGVVIAFNGQAFALLPQVMAALKGALDRAVTGLTL